MYVATLDLWLTQPQGALSSQFDSHDIYKSMINHVESELRRTLDEADQLQTLLVDTFKLLMSSLAVRDSRLNMEQARLSADQAKRNAWLAQLASIYLPLSVVTGIFGMNLKELDERKPSFWWAIVVLVVLVALTMGIFFGLRRMETELERRREAKRLSERGA